MERRNAFDEESTRRSAEKDRDSVDKGKITQAADPLFGPDGVVDEIKRAEIETSPDESRKDLHANKVSGER